MYIYNVQYKHTLSLHMKYEHCNSYLINRHKLKNMSYDTLNMTNEKPILVRGDEDLLLHPHESSFGIQTLLEKNVKSILTHLRECRSIYHKLKL